MAKFNSNSPEGNSQCFIVQHDNNNNKRNNIPRMKGNCYQLKSRKN